VSVVPARLILAVPERWHQRLVVLAVLVLVSVAVAGALTLHQPGQYAAQTTVFVGRVLPATSADVDASVTDFETVIRLPEVVTAVAQQTGVAPDRIARGLSFQRLGSSSAVQVTYHSASAATAAAVAVAASHQVVLTLARQQVDGATDGVTAAQGAVQLAQAALTALDQRQGVTDIQVEYQARQQDLSTLENQLGSAAPGQVALLGLLITLRTQQLGALGAALPQYQQLSANVTQATATLQAAEQALTQDQGKADAAGSPTILTPANLTKQSRGKLLARAFVATTVAAVLLVIALFLMVDRVGARRTSGPDGAPAARHDGAGYAGRGPVLAPER
jgi:hypothetical protein